MTTDYLGLYPTNKAFASAVKKTAAAEGRVRDRYVTYSLHALAHFKEHGDATRLTTLFNVMGERSPYRKLLLTWAKAFAPVSIKIDGANGTFKLRNKRKDEQRKPRPQDTDLAGAGALPFWQIKGMPGDISMNPYAQIKMILKNYEDALAGEKARVKDVVKMSESDRKKLEMMVSKEHKEKIILKAA